MKKIILTGFFALISIVTFSQFHIGIRAGVSTNYFDLTENNYNNYLVSVPKDKKTGFHVGIVSQLELSDFFIQPELNFSSANNDIILYDLNVPGDEGTLDNHKFTKLNLPVMIGYKIKALKIQAGPVGSVLLSSKSDVLKDNGVEQSLKSMTYGYQVGLGLDLGKIALDLKYEGNLSKFGDGITINGNEVNFDQRIEQIIFSIGIFIL